MFDNFFGDVKETYNSIEDFFGDLIDKEDILDVVKSSSKKLLGNEKGNSNIFSQDSAIIDTDTQSPSGVMSPLDEVINISKAVTSVDGQELERQWLRRLLALSKNEVYNDKI